MLKVECRYRAKLELIESLLYAIENDDNLNDLEQVLTYLKRSELFYRSQLVELR